MNSFHKAFLDLHNMHSEFFRSCNNERNIAELTDSEIRLFHDIHGKEFANFGYLGEGVAGDDESDWRDHSPLAAVTDLKRCTL